MAPFLLYWEGSPEKSGYVLICTVLLLGIGSVVGGSLYRAKSNGWPEDPSARLRQVVASFALTLVLPVILVSLAQPAAQRGWIALAGIAIGLAISAGIFVSGTRRFRLPKPID